MSSNKNNNEPERRQVQVVIEEAAGKRIRQLVIQGPPDPDMNDFALCISFDDDTTISVELSLLLRFGIFYDRPLTVNCKQSRNTQNECWNEDGGCDV